MNTDLATVFLAQKGWVSMSLLCTVSILTSKQKLYRNLFATSENARCCIFKQDCSYLPLFFNVTENKLRDMFTHVCKLPLTYIAIKSQAQFPCTCKHISQCAFNHIEKQWQIRTTIFETATPCIFECCKKLCKLKEK